MQAQAQNPKIHMHMHIHHIAHPGPSALLTLHRNVKRKDKHNARLQEAKTNSSTCNSHHQDQGAVCSVLTCTHKRQLATQGTLKPKPILPLDNRMLMLHWLHLTCRHPTNPISNGIHCPCTHFCYLQSVPRLSAYACCAFSHRCVADKGAAT